MMRALRDECGTVIAEYALVLAFLSLLAISGLQLIDDTTSLTLGQLQDALINYGLSLGA